MSLVIASVRDGIKTRLETISGLRGADTVPDKINPPIAIVGLVGEIEYDHAMNRGLDKLILPVNVIVSRASERKAQDKLDAYCDSASSTSIKTAIEGDKTLGGTCQTLRVSRMTRQGEVEAGGVIYLAAEFELEVWG